MMAGRPRLSASKRRQSEHVAAAHSICPLMRAFGEFGNYMRVVLFIFILLFCRNLFAEESCTLKDLGLSSDPDHPASLYYVGTCNYRNYNYTEAAKLWQALVDIHNIDSEYHELQVDAHNNLGYLLFYGYGIEADQDQALTLWNKAISLGHTESEFHLCHAYADANEKTYDPIKAKLHCNKAELIYRGIEERDETEETILKLIKEYRAKLPE